MLWTTTIYASYRCWNVEQNCRFSVLPVFFTSFWFEEEKIDIIVPCSGFLIFGPSIRPLSLALIILSFNFLASSGTEPHAAVDVKGLLAKLQRTGILSALNVNSRRDETGGGDSPNRSVTPPIPSEHRGEVTERLPRPPTDLKSFSMRALRMLVC